MTAPRSEDQAPVRPRRPLSGEGASNFGLVAGRGRRVDESLRRLCLAWRDLEADTGPVLD